MNNFAADIQNTIDLDRLRSKLLGRPVATAIFTRMDGAQFALSDVRPDSIGPGAEAHGVVGVEFENDADKIVHLPFIHSWQIEWSL